jgi:predicted regulator of Ras-like GTPase activity (Roadblock/LC7/MglB family)
MPTENKSKDDVEGLREALQEIRGRKGIEGYILRASDSASIDLKDPSKIGDYAVLSATAFEEGGNMANTFGVGEVSNIILEGAKIKMLLLAVGDHRLSVFMERNVDHDMLCKDLDLA